MKSSIYPLATAVLCAALAVPAHATTYHWNMACTEDQVSNSGVGDGSTDSTAIGDADLRYDTLTGRLSYDIRWDGLGGLLTAIHVHGPAAPLANNMQHIFNVYTDAADVIASGVDRTTGRVYGFDELTQLIVDSGGPHNEVNALSYMVDEMAYVNIHSEIWPMGEIRCHFDLFETLTGTEQTKGQQKCTNDLNKSAQKLAKAQAKLIASCVKSAGKDGPSGSETCVVTDSKSKVSGAQAKTTEVFGASCGAANLPAYGVTDAATINAAMVTKELDLVHDLFGANLDAGLAGPGDDAKCQAAVYKATTKCQAARLKDFASCVKSDLTGKTGLTVVDGYGIAKCVGSDRKAKIAKACDPANGKLRATIDKKCVAAGVDLAAVFPVCGQAAAADTATCIDRSVACRTCLAIDATDALGLDCDALDDGQDNGSCVLPD